MWIISNNVCLLLAVFLSTTLPVTTNAQQQDIIILDADACTMCQDGSGILSPDSLVEETGQTCAELEEEANTYSDPLSCRYYHRYGNKCGCNNVPPPESSCELCQDSSSIADDELWLDGYDGSCGTLQVDAAWNLWDTFDENNNNNCNYYHHAGSLCGCSHNRPPATGCDLCMDGSAPLMGRKSVTPGNAAEATCQAYSQFSKYVHVRDTEECEKTQSVVGSYCGCSETPSSSNADADSLACDFCPPGLVTKDGWAPALDLEQDNRVFYFRDAPCIKVAMLATEFDFICSNVPAEFVEACCEPAADLMRPEVFVQDDPTVVLDYDEDAADAKSDDIVDWESVIILSGGGATTEEIIDSGAGSYFTEVTGVRLVFSVGVSMALAMAVL